MKATIFFSTRNRPALLRKTLSNIEAGTSDCAVLIGNACSTKYLKETSEIINSHPNAQEIVYNPDPGLSLVYSDLYNHINTELAIVWADDMLFLQDPQSLFHHFQCSQTQLVALPMIDDISQAPLTTGKGWPKDKHGCALWNTPTGRCAHHAITRVDFFKKFKNICGSGKPHDVIDNFCHRHTTESQRVWPEGAYLLHERIDDETRRNTMFSSDNFRFPALAEYKTAKERESSINESL